MGSRLLALAFCGALVVTGAVPSAAQARRLTVVATTPTLASLAQGAAGTTADVRSLVPVGVSPEDYQPTPADIAALANADVLVENGAGLEGWLDRTIRNAANAHLRIVVCTDGLPVIDGNPHLWMDPVYAQAYVRKISAALVAADPAHAATYRAATAAYEKQLGALTAWIRAQIDRIPPANRKLVVFHDAFLYYARRFGLQVTGAIEPIAGAEPNPQHVADLIALMKREHVKAIFAEHEYNPALAATVAASAGRLKVAYVYDDSLGPTPDVATYIGMLRTDTRTIVDALR